MGTSLAESPWPLPTESTADYALVRWDASLEVNCILTYLGALFSLKGQGFFQMISIAISMCPGGGGGEGIVKV